MTSSEKSFASLKGSQLTSPPRSGRTSPTSPASPPSFLSARSSASCPSKLSEIPHREASRAEVKRNAQAGRQQKTRHPPSPEAASEASSRSSLTPADATSRSNFPWEAKARAELNDDPAKREQRIDTFCAMVNSRLVFEHKLRKRTLRSALTKVANI